MDASVRPLGLGAVLLRRRVVMAPLTRMRALRPGDVPHALDATYYGRCAGLIIAEAADVSVQAAVIPARPASTRTGGYGAGAGSWAPCTPRAA